MCSLVKQALQNLRAQEQSPIHVSTRYLISIIHGLDSGELRYMIRNGTILNYSGRVTVHCAIPLEAWSMGNGRLQCCPISHYYCRRHLLAVLESLKGGYEDFYEPLPFINGVFSVVAVFVRHFRIGSTRGQTRHARDASG